VASSGPVVGIVGMAALRRDINRMAADQSGPLYQAIREAGRQAAEPVAMLTRSTLPRETRSTDAGALLDTVRTSGTRTGAAVRMGTPRVSWAGWIEFGGTRRKPHESSRPIVRDGRYLFPAARQLAAGVADRYSAAIGRILNTDTVWTNTTNDGGAVHD
jgi:hypothetical protein